MAGSHRRAKRDPATDLFDRWLSHRQDEAQPEAEPPPEEAAPTATAADPGPVTPPGPSVEDPQPAAPSAAPPSVGASTDVDFAPRTRAHRVVGLLLLLAVVGTVLAGYAAYRDPTTLIIGVAATLGVLVLVLWGVLAGTPTTHLAVRAGQLEVIQDGGRFVFELAGSYTPIEVVGKPGDRDWKVLFLRRNMDPFVIDSSIVDPREFMAVLRRYRPE